MVTKNQAVVGVRDADASAHRRTVRRVRSRDGADRRTGSPSSDDSTADERTQSIPASALGAGPVCVRRNAHHAGSGDQGDSWRTARRGPASVECACVASYPLFASGDGASARAIQELAGHADLSTTQCCMHLSPAATEDAIRLLDERLGGLKVAQTGGI